jgi:hypothetical protein
MDEENPVLEVRRYKGLKSLPEGYEAVFQQAGRRNIFFSKPWFENFEQTILGPNESAIIYGVEENHSSKRALGILALKSSEERPKLFSPRTIEGLSNYYTAHFGPILIDDCDDIFGVSNALAFALWDHRHSWDVLRLAPLDPKSLSYETLLIALRQRGMLVQTYFCFGNWYLDVNGRTYNDYVQTLPSILKETIRRKGKRLDKRKGVRIEIITDVERVPAAVDDYTKVYLASWKNPEPFPLFMPGFIHTCAKMGWLRLGLVYIDNEPAAAQLWVVSGEGASIYKLAYDERFSNLSVGTVLTARMMEHVIDIDRVHKVDYLSGDDEYKRNWMSHRTERWGILAFNPHSLKGLTYAARHIGGRFTKRSVLQATRLARRLGNI